MRKDKAISVLHRLTRLLPLENIFCSWTRCRRISKSHTRPATQRKKATRCMSILARNQKEEFACPLLVIEYAAACPRGMQIKSTVHGLESSGASRCVVVFKEMIQRGTAASSTPPCITHMLRNGLHLTEEKHQHFCGHFSTPTSACTREL